MKLTTQYVRWRVEFWRDSVGLFTSENIYVVEREKVYKKSSWVNFFSHTQKQIVDINFCIRMAIRILVKKSAPRGGGPSFGVDTLWRHYKY